MEILVHEAGREDPAIVEVEETIAVRELIAMRGGDDESRVWLVDREEELDLDIRLVDAGVRHHHRVHHGRCRSVAVTVRYNEDDKHRSFGPSTTVARLKQWAESDEEFNIPHSERPKLVLALPGANTYLSSSVHVGSVADDHCAVTLDLLPKERFEG